MKTFKYYKDVPKDFTGICQILYMDEIIYYENGKIHNENGHALLAIGNHKLWYYKGKCYGSDNDFTIETWKEKVEYLKREEELKIFI